MKPNGCGPKWLPIWIKVVMFNWFFEASCDKHDISYSKGGTEKMRREYDYKFWQAMKRDTLRFDGFERIARWQQALLYFFLVRAFGWYKFQYTEKK